MINAAKLPQESVSDAERKAQAYVNDPEVVAPSVITLNGVATAHAANDFLFYITGMRDPNAVVGYQRFHPILGAPGPMNRVIVQTVPNAVLARKVDWRVATDDVCPHWSARSVDIYPRCRIVCHARSTSEHR